ncbi:MAG: ArsR family transcriptional regulator [Acidobacteria bacterium]|nr:ArsR family transcriptional regulator [Acidobacteriota bacterium]
MTFSSALPALDPPGFLQLAGHPVRWRLLEELSVSDRAVRELTDLVGMPQNLLSYHLAKLRDGQLVSARRSSADRRDTYYSIRLDGIGQRLAATGAAIHASLRLRTEAPVTPIKPGRKVLFACTGNSARSQMAEALLRARSGGAVAAFSAGSAPKALHPNAVRVMRDVHGLDLANQHAKHLDTFAGERFDRVISLCDKVREVCPAFPGEPQIIHWSLANPATGESDAATYPLFVETAAELNARIAALIAQLADADPEQT